MGYGIVIGVDFVEVFSFFSLLFWKIHMNGRYFFLLSCIKDFNNLDCFGSLDDLL